MIRSTLYELCAATCLLDKIIVFFMMASILFTCVATAPALEVGYVHVMSLLVL